MTDDDLIAKVKAGIGITTTSDVGGIFTKTLAVKQYMLNAGVTQEQIESDIGIATLTVGVSDLWNLNSGEVEFSSAFMTILLPQLMAVSLPEETTP